ncbi:MAG TPA: paraquat-inducible protein A [Kofleriaceae bacterium]
MSRAIDLDLVVCETCELVMRRGSGTCPRCKAMVHPRKPQSRRRSIALLIAATALYFPANALVMMHTEQWPMRRDDTILSGIGYLWERDEPSLAIIVFTASILVPLLKIGALALLLFTTSRHSGWALKGRTKLYRVLEAIGHWSMLDVFVVALLTAVVQLGRFAKVAPGPAVVPFAGVVVLTMLASAAFDPRAIWDRGFHE